MSNSSPNGSSRLPAAPSTCFELPGTPAAGLAARQALLAADAAWPDRVRDDVLLLATEIVTNAVRHGGAGPDQPVRVELGLHSALVRVAVFDQGPGFPRPTPGSGFPASGGWGLFLVERLADRWAVETTSEGTCVWFEVGYAA
ncbi:MAG TPA: ATP-binding protein [Thermoleophilaceae bacterium]|nr:ATP-binding protein [Thermoleophilaceae bacterium]